MRSHDGLLWDIDPDAGSATLVGPTATTSVTDLAITADGKIVAIELERADLFDPATGAATDLSMTPWLTKQNALDVLPDGRLLVGGLGELAAVDLSTGAVEMLSMLPVGFKFSGDIAVIDGDSAFATAFTGSDEPDQLMLLDVSSGGADVVGSIGAQDVWGLDYGCDGSLYGLTDGGDGPPQLLRIDALTGMGTLVASFPGGPDGLWGASGPAE